MLLSKSRELVPVSDDMAVALLIALFSLAGTCLSILFEPAREGIAMQAEDLADLATRLSRLNSLYGFST